MRDSSTGGDPIGVVLIGAPNAEQELLNDAYAFEQATKIRDAGPPYMIGPAQFGPVTGAPSMTNQSMWRCIEGSAFYHPYACNAGEVGTPSAAGPTGTAVDGDVGGTRAGDALADARRTGDRSAPFTPGVAKDYTASTTANVISTAGDAALSVSDPGHLTNGAFSLPSAARGDLQQVGLDRARVQRPGHDRLQAAHRRDRRAAHGDVLARR